MRLDILEDYTRFPRGCGGASRCLPLPALLASPTTPGHWALTLAFILTVATLVASFPLLPKTHAMLMWDWLQPRGCG